MIPKAYAFQRMNKDRWKWSGSTTKQKYWKV